MAVGASPAPILKLERGHTTFSDGCLVHASSKRYADGELHSVFGMTALSA